MWMGLGSGREGGDRRAPSVPHPEDRPTLPLSPHSLNQSKHNPFPKKKHQAEFQRVQELQRRRMQQEQEAAQAGSSGGGSQGR